MMRNFRIFPLVHRSPPARYPRGVWSRRR